MEGVNILEMIRLAKLVNHRIGERANIGGGGGYNMERNRVGDSTTEERG